MRRVEAHRVSDLMELTKSNICDILHKWGDLIFVHWKGLCVSEAERRWICC